MDCTAERKTLAEVPDALRQIRSVVVGYEGQAKAHADFVSGSEPEKPEPDTVPQAPVTNLQDDVWKQVSLLAYAVARTGRQLDRLERGLGLGRAAQEVEKDPGRLVEVTPVPMPAFGGGAKLRPLNHRELTEARLREARAKVEHLEGVLRGIDAGAGGAEGDRIFKAALPE